MIGHPFLTGLMQSQNSNVSAYIYYSLKKFMIFSKSFKEALCVLAKPESKKFKCTVIKKKYFFFLLFFMFIFIFQMMYCGGDLV